VSRSSTTVADSTVPTLANNSCSSLCLKEIDSEEEERRLWYVALTRAKDELYITYPLMITDYNRQTVLQKPSRFVMECPPALFEVWTLEEDTPQFLQPILPEPGEFIN
jgi:superfamily I DNA/RNA helicase